MTRSCLKRRWASARRGLWRRGFRCEAGKLMIRVDFAAGSRFAVEGVAGEHPVHDTVTKRYRHLNFFQHECLLEVRTPRVKLPDGSVRLVSRLCRALSGFTLLFEALVLMLARQMPVCGGGAHRGRVAVPGDGDLRALRRAGTGAGRLQPRSRRWPSTRPRVPGVMTTSPWQPMPSSGACWPSPRGAMPRPSATGRRAGGPRLCARADRVGQHRHVACLHQGLRRAVAQRAHHLRQFHVVWHASTPWTRCGASSSAPTSPSRACAGRC